MIHTIYIMQLVFFEPLSKFTIKVIRVSISSKNLYTNNLQDSTYIKELQTYKILISRAISMIDIFTRID